MTKPVVNEIIKINCGVLITKLFQFSGKRFGGDHKKNSKSQRSRGNDDS